MRRKNYLPESFKIICLTCIWLKFVDTSFHSTQKSRPATSHVERHFSNSLKNPLVKLKTPQGLKLGTQLAKSINFLWAKFGGNRK